MTSEPPAGGIAILVYDFRGSGVVRNALRIAGAAREAGLDVSLWPIRNQGDLAGQVPAGVPVRPIRARPGGLQRDLDSLASVPAIAAAIDRDRPRLLFSTGNHVHLHAALALRRARFGRTVRFVGRVSNAVVAAGGRGWRRAAGLVERFQYQAMDRLIAVSGELAGDLADTFGLDRGRIAVVPNGIDVAAIEAAALEPIYHPFFAPGAPPVALGVGRFSRQKNFEGLLRAFAAARRRRPIRLIILGSGSPRRRRRLAQLARELGVAEDVDMPGFVANPFPWFARSGLFVLNSRWEGGSNVLLEALACGCPVVAARAPAGIVEVMEAGRLGPLVPVGDDDSLAAAMIDRLGQPRDSAVLRARAQEYDLRRSLAAYVAILAAEQAVAAR